MLLVKKVLNISKKVFLVIAVYFTIISLFLYFINKNKLPIKAENNLIEKNRQEIYKIINDKKINSSKQGKLSIALYRATMCGMIGESCTDNPADGDKNFDKSTFGFISKVISLPYTHPPASGIYWVYSGLQNAGFIPKTYAAEGIGLAAIKPFNKLWQSFRDISYMLLVIVLIAIGFMVMFRMKLNPQTVITVENALPRIVISLLLITFSYAIAGFLIDLMYLIISVIIVLMSNLDIPGSIYVPAKKLELLNKFSGGNFTNIFFFPFNIMKVGNSLINIFPASTSFILRRVVGGVIGFTLSKLFYDNFLKGLLEGLNNVSAATFGIGQIPGIIGWFIVLFLALLFFAGIGMPLLFGLLVLFTIVFLLFRILFLLVTTYIQILIMIIFAPIFLIFEAIPGKSAFSYWIKNLFANLLTFPVVVILILVGGMIMTVAEQMSGNLWSPPFLYGFDTTSFSTLVGLGIILLIPDFVRTTKELLGVKDLPFQIGLGTFFGGATAAWGGVQGGVGLFTSLTQMPGLGLWLQQQADKGGFMSKIMPPTMQESLLRAMRNFEAEQLKKKNG